MDYKEYLEDLTYDMSREYVVYHMGHNMFLSHVRYPDDSQDIQCYEYCDELCLDGETVPNEQYFRQTMIFLNIGGAIAQVKSIHLDSDKIQDFFLIPIEDGDLNFSEAVSIRDYLE